MSDTDTPTPDTGDRKEGWARIRDERARHASKGFTPEHDAHHHPAEFLNAAVCYIEAAMLLEGVHRFATVDGPALLETYDEDDPRRVHTVAYIEAAKADPIAYLYNYNAPMQWPWRPEEFKPKADPERNLEIAGSFIAAALDRGYKLPEGVPA